MKRILSLLMLLVCLALPANAELIQAPIQIAPVNGRTVILTGEGAPLAFLFEASPAQLNITAPAGTVCTLDGADVALDGLAAVNGAHLLETELTQVSTLTVGDRTALLFPDEESLNAHGEWSFGDAAYALTFTDEAGNPLAGVMANICDDTSCTMMVSDENGRIEFVRVPNAYEIHVIRVPDGYAFDATETFTTDPAGGELIFTVPAA